MEMASRWNSVTERGLALLLATCLLAALPIQPASAQEATQSLDPAVAAIAARIPNLIEEVHPAVVQILVSSYGPAADNPSSLLAADSPSWSLQALALAPMAIRREPRYSLPAERRRR